MKKYLLVAALLLIPAVSFAQTPQPSQTELLLKLISLLQQEIAELQAPVQTFGAASTTPVAATTTPVEATSTPTGCVTRADFTGNGKIFVSACGG